MKGDCLSAIIDMSVVKLSYILWPHYSVTIYNYIFANWGKICQNTNEKLFKFKR